MKSALCVDFGTSSIRAVVRDHLGGITVVPLGAVTKNRSIDGASIPSTVCVAADGKTVSFGEHAYSKIKGGQPLAFWSASPKLWLKQPHTLDGPVASDVEVTRRELLTGLLGYALFAASESGQWDAPADPSTADIRVAHPVWPSSSRDEAQKALGQMVWLATHMASAGDWGETSVEVLRSWTGPEGDEESVPTYVPQVDTVEPVAAAVELLSGDSNERRLCAVVDVGAGTTDIGIFQQVIPDATVPAKARMIPAGPSASVFKAGDTIDSALMSLLARRFPREYKIHESSIKVDIRRLKEDLFVNQRLQSFDMDLPLRSLEESREMEEIISEIRRGLVNCLRDAHRAIEVWYGVGVSIRREITLLMAGGGAGLKILREALGHPVELSGQRYHIKVIDAVPPQRIQMHGAGYTRLAVALGGVREAYERVVHEHQKLSSIPGLGLPKQRVV
jgi:hypothetical protein